jgi:DNA polymerase III subunit alpha
VRDSDFVHLHNHSSYSLLDGVSKPSRIVKRALELEHEAVALTDHGAMYGTVEFYQAARDAGIKPILGCEIYVAARGHQDKDPQQDRRSHHLLLLARNNDGYRNLMGLVSRAHMDGFYYHPRVDHELLHKHGDGLVALSGCVAGEIPRALADGNLDSARELIQTFQGHFGADNFFLEVQHHPDLDIQNRSNDGVFELSEELGIPVIATNDSHYACTGDAEAQDTLLAIQTNTTLDTEDRMSMMDGNYSLIPTEEMASHFPSYPDVITNSLRVAEICNVEIELGKARLPSFPTPREQTSTEYLRELCEEGLETRYPVEKQDDGTWNLREGHDVDELPVSIPKINERLDFELETIAGMGFDVYFLIVWDYVRWAKDHGIIVGPGRGSAAGALVTYSLGITELDPLKYDLLFERFLNPDRVSMPDADIDFDDEHRDEVIEYVRDKYGRDCVASVITFGTMQAKGALKDVGRAMGLTYEETDRLAKLLPSKPGIELAECLTSEKEFKEAYDADPQNKRLVDLAIQLEGVTRHTSVHPCAVVISDEPLEHFTPLQYAPRSEGVVISQYGADDLEDLGLLKMDFLGLRTLTVIRRTVEMIRNLHGVDIDVYNLPLEDEKTYDLMSRGDTTAVFQLESGGMKRYLRELRPNEFEDIIAMVALYRPGPMQFIEDYCNRKHGKAEVKYDHPLMEDALKNSYGITVYQEQVMQMSRDLAGFTRGEADTLRKAMGKKDAALMGKLKTQFTTGAPERGVDEKLAEKIWADWENFASYAFNKSHAACYAYVAFQTGYLKAHYPSELMAASLTSEMDKSDRIIVLIDECRRMGLQVLPPDVNESVHHFTVSDLGIRFGMLAVKNVGSSAIDAIIEARDNDGVFSSIYDFCRRVDLKSINKRMIESLIQSGAMDRFGERNRLIKGLDGAINWALREQADELRGQVSLFGDASDGDGASDFDTTPELPLVAPMNAKERLQQERELLGFYVSGHPLDNHRYDVDLFCTHSSDGLSEVAREAPMLMAGVVGAVRKLTTKKGDAMAIVTMEDFAGTYEAVVFPQAYESAKELLEIDQIVMLRGSRDREEAKIIVDEVINIADARQRLANAMDVTVVSRDLDDAGIDELRNIVSVNGGNVQVFIKIATKEHGPLRFRVDSKKVNPTDELIERLNKHAAVEDVSFKPITIERDEPKGRRRWGKDGQNGGQGSYGGGGGAYRK